jgi:hypothetical protein
MQRIQGTRESTTRSRRRATVAGLVALLACAGGALLNAAVAGATSCAGGKCTVPFASTGSLQEWQVPSGVSSATFEAKGAGGGGSFDPGGHIGGSGANVSSTLLLTEKAKLKLVVGAGGPFVETVEAFGGGGKAPFAAFSPGGGGGGGSFVFSEAGSLLIAAGGGGGGGGRGAGSSGGGNGGETGTAGEAHGASGGGGATAGAGGTAGEHAKAGQGPTTSTAIEGKGGEGAKEEEGGGGGGGGLYGGGGGGATSSSSQSGGGGGGSSAVNGGSGTVFEAGKGGAGGGAHESGHGGEVTIAFNQPAMNVGLVASSEAVAVGQSVTFTATVSPAPSGGTVAFEEAGTPISGCATQAVSTSTGIATCTTEYTSPSGHTVEGLYSGSADTVYRGAISAPTQVVATDATGITLAASSTSPAVGSTVTYTATVSPAPTSGTVSFYDAGTGISGCGTQGINTNTGVATCEVKYTAAGSHSITASFSGSVDGSLTPSSTATAIAVTVSATAVPAAPATTTAAAAVKAPPPALGPVVLTRAPQPLINTRLLTIFYRCGSSACSGSVAITVQLPHGRPWHLKGSAEASAAGGTPSHIRVSVPWSLRHDVRRYLRHHRHYRVRIDVSVTLTSAGGAPRTTHLVLPIWTLPGLR